MVPLFFLLLVGGLGLLLSWLLLRAFGWGEMVAVPAASALGTGAKLVALSGVVLLLGALAPPGWQWVRDPLGALIGVGEYLGRHGGGVGGPDWPAPALDGTWRLRFSPADGAEERVGDLRLWPEGRGVYRGELRWERGAPAVFGRIGGEGPLLCQVRGTQVMIRCQREQWEIGLRGEIRSDGRVMRGTLDEASAGSGAWWAERQ